MNDNDVIKALEYCCDGGVDHCKGCPCFEHTEGCVGEREALDVIHHLQAEIKQKDTEIDILIRKKETLKDEVAELQRKNSELEIELKAMRGAANSYKSEVERLQQANESFSCMGKMYSEIKSEARKEFAERLKEHKHECGCNYRKKPVYAITVEKIDNLLEEMESERE